jgi:hypothetical protein
MKKILKTFIVLGALGGMFYFAYSHFSGEGISTFAKDQGGANMVASVASAGTLNSTAFLSTLLSLNRINVDDSIFKTKSFSSLRDNTVPIASDTPVGRPNPFASIDIESSSDSNISFPQINLNTNTSTR